METNPNLPPAFWANVQKTHSCWEWTGPKNKPVNGYGWFYFNGKQQLAHRLVCKEIPPGACVLHTCDNPACVNPEHLFFGSKSDNAKDAVSKDRDVAFKKAKLTPEAVREIRALPRTIAVAREYAERYGVTESTVNQAQNLHTWKRLDTGPKPTFEVVPRTGEMAGNAKLTEDDVHHIRGVPQFHGVLTLLAQEHGVTVGCIQAIRDGRTWKSLVWKEGTAPHVPAPRRPPPPKLTARQARLAQQATRRQRRAPVVSP